MSIESILGNIISVIIGGFITWVCSWIYYKIASDDLRKEAKELGRLSALILAFLNNKGDATVNYDEQGNPKGINVNIKANLIGGGNLKADLSTKKDQTPK